MNIQQLTLHCRNRKLQKHFRAAEYLSSRSPPVPADPESGKGTGIPRISTGQAKGLELTEKGMFLPKAQEMLKDWNRFKEEVISGTEHKKLKSDLVPESIPTDCFRRLPDILKGIRSLR